MGTGAQIYTMRKSLNQEKNLHDHELALSTEQHFTSLSTELLAIAKEADRDVWEQRNNQFDQMLVCAVLMFGVAVGNINEGTYGFDKYEDQHNGLNAAVVFSRDGMFIILSAIAIASLFVCIVACLLVNRRMSSYMIERSSNLVDRLAVSTGLAHQISGTAQQQHDDWQFGAEPGAQNIEGILGYEKRRFHDKMGAAIGSGPREARERRHRFGGGGGFGSFTNKSAPTHGRFDKLTTHEESDSDSDYQRFNDPPDASAHAAGAAGNGTERPAIRPNGIHLPNGDGEGGGMPAARAADLRQISLRRQMSMQRRAAAPLNFGIFYREHCGTIARTVTYSFVIGVLSTWSSVWFLLWSSIP